MQGIGQVANLKKAGNLAREKPIFLLKHSGVRKFVSNGRLRRTGEEMERPKVSSRQEGGKP